MENCLSDKPRNKRGGDLFGVLSSFIFHHFLLFVCLSFNHSTVFYACVFVSDLAR